MAPVLIVSNGIGEDLIASTIVKRLRTAGIQVTAYPLVGVGAYPPEIPVLDPRQNLPSGGFSTRAGNRRLMGDLAGGLVRLWFAQRATLRAQRNRYDAVVAVGDGYCLWMASRTGARPVFVATADSARISPFGTWAKAVMRRSARCIFTRDTDTADALSKIGLPATAAGTIAVDEVQPTGLTFGLPAGALVVTLLPGSRQDAGENAAILARAVRAIAAEANEVQFLLPVAPGASRAEIARRLGGAGAPGGTDPARAASGPDDAGAPEASAVEVGTARVILTPAFADAITRAHVVIGLAGTANEQAAGIGRPVVAFPAASAQFGAQFLAAQHLLLSDALVPVADWREAAAAVLRLLRDPAERARRGAVGRERMGPPGGSRRVADAILEILRTSAGHSIQNT
jgi:uncharacterized protein (TIGR03492 family)